MSLKSQFVAANAAFSTLNNPASSLQDVANAVKTLFAGDSDFWKEIAKQAQRALRPKAEKLEEKVAVEFSTPVTTTAEIGTAPMSKVELLPPPTKLAPAMKQVAPTVINLNRDHAPSQPQTSPERQLNESPTERVARWFAVLSKYVAGSLHKLDGERTRQTAKWVFLTSGVKLTGDQWGTLFAAMKKARENGGHIIGGECKPAQIFAAAPRELVDDFVFGQDGEISSICAALGELEGDMPKRLVARCYLLVAALEALDSVEPRLSDFDVDQIDNVYHAVDKVGGPTNLLEKIGAILFEGEDEPVRPATARLEDIARLKKPSAKELNKLRAS